MDLSQVFVSLRSGANKLSQLNASQKNLGLLSAASSIDKNPQTIFPVDLGFDSKSSTRRKADSPAPIIKVLKPQIRLWMLFVVILVKVYRTR